MGVAALRQRAGPHNHEAHHHHQLGQQDEADQCAQRRVLHEPGSQLRKVHVQHHDHEQEQHGHRADVDHDQDHGQELGTQQHEESGRIEEGEDQEQHGVHRVLGGDDHEPRRHGQGREQVEEGGGQRHGVALARDIVGWVERSDDPTQFAIACRGVGSALTLDPTYTRRGALHRHTLTDTSHRARSAWRSRVPNGRRWRAGAPCRSRAPRASRSRTRSWGLRRWHRPGRPPGTARSRCI